MSFRQPSVLPGFGLTFGFTTFFLSAIVLLPLAALALAAASLHWSDFVHVVLSPRALGSYRLSFGASFLAAAINLESEEHTSELQSQSNLVCRLLLEKQNNDST